MFDRRNTESSSIQGNSKDLVYFHCMSCPKVELARIVGLSAKSGLVLHLQCAREERVVKGADTLVPRPLEEARASAR